MAQKPDTQSFAFVRALDNARNICDHERLILPDPHDAQRRFERRERVIRHFRLRRRQHGNQHALARIRKAHDAHVGQQAEFERKVSLYSLFSRLGVPGRLVRRRPEKRIAPAASPPRRQGQPLARFAHLAQYFPGIALFDDGAKRYAQHNILTGAPGSVVSGACLPVFGEMVPIVAQIEQGIQIAVPFEQYGTSAPAVSACGTAVRFVFFSTEGDGSRPPASAPDGDRYVIDKVHTCVRVCVYFAASAFVPDSCGDGSVSASSQAAALCRLIQSIPYRHLILQNITIYTDGACSGNPGPGGWAALLMHESRRKQLSGGASHTTNNRMELTAALEALRHLRTPCKVRLHTDSAYLANAFNQRWLRGWQRNGWKTAGKKPVENRDLWEALLAESARHRITWIKVKGHADNEFNNLADAAAVAAMQEYKRPQDSEA